MFGFCALPVCAAAAAKAEGAPASHCRRVCAEEPIRAIRVIIIQYAGCEYVLSILQTHDRMPFMGSSFTLAQSTAMEVLANLPDSEIRMFAAGQQIYVPGCYAGDIYRVLDGRVKVVRQDGTRTTAVVDVCGPGDFFGESALLGNARDREQAVALSPARIMKWSVVSLTRALENDPSLALGLLRFSAQRCAVLKTRLESFSADDTLRRLARCLMHFAERQIESPGGYASIPPLTHELLAHYIGTSREIVTHQMTKLRTLGLIQYSRHGIEVRCGDLRDWLDGKARTSHA